MIAAIAKRELVNSLPITLQVKAAYPFAARNADELNLDEGDVIKVLRQEDEHWWVGEMEDGRQGYFPASYTVMIGKI